MGETRWRWFSYLSEDAKAAQAELDRLAEDGLELLDVKLCLAKFRRLEGRAAPRCWVGPVRWPDVEGSAQEKRRDYFALCRSCGWALVKETGGLWYFKALPGAGAVPIETDGRVEWEAVWRGRLSTGIGCALLALYGPLMVWGFRRDARLVWHNGTPPEMIALNAAQFLIWLVALAVELGLWRYRRVCRRALEAGEALPVPGARAARLRGLFHPAVALYFGLLLGGAVLYAVLTS